VNVCQAIGRVDILVNNAGISHPGSLVTLDEAAADEMIGVNLKGVMHCARAVAPGMMERRYGRIVNIASIAGYGTAPARHHAVRGDQRVARIDGAYRVQEGVPSRSALDTRSPPDEARVQGPRMHPLERATVDARHTGVHRVARRFLEPIQDLLVLGIGLALFGLMVRSGGCWCRRDVRAIPSARAAWWTTSLQSCA
jgi:short subunit dehydrogenase